MSQDPGSRLVYSTDGGRVRQPRNTPHNRLVAPARPAAVSTPDDGIVRVQRDRRGRGGKTATTITGLPGAEAELDARLKHLKQLLGTGGTREGRILVLQGDQRARAAAELEAIGFRVRLAGG